MRFYHLSDVDDVDSDRSANLTEMSHAASEGDA